MKKNLPALKISLAKCYNAFTASFRKHSTVLLSASFVLFVISVVCLERLSYHVPRGLVGEEQLLEDPHDDLYHNYVRIVAQENDPRKNKVYVVGGSSAREFISLSSDMSKMAKARGLDVAFEKLATSSQTLSYTLNIIHHLPRSSGRVLIGVSPSAISRDAEYDERYVKFYATLPTSREMKSVLSTYSPWDSLLLARVLRQCFRAVGIDNRHSGRLATFLRTRVWHSVPYQELRYELGLRPEEKKWRTHETGVRKRLALFQQNVDRNVRRLKEVVAAARTRGLDPILVELPRNPRFHHLYERVGEAYTARLRKLSKTERVPYWEQIVQDRLVADDFYDSTHLLETGRAKVNVALLAKLEDYMRSQSRQLSSQ